MTFPTTYYDQREVENLPGVEFKREDKKTFYAEDFTALGDEITAIETLLGNDVAGTYATVAERLDNSGGGAGFLYEKKILGAGINQITFDTPISLDSEGFLRMRFIFPGNLLNSSLRLLFDDDTTPTNYPRTMITTDGSTINAITLSSSNLGGLGGGSERPEQTTSWDFELRKLPGKYVNVYGRSSTQASGVESDFNEMNMHYKGTNDDITDVRFKIDSGNFPEGTIAILSGV